MTLPPTVGIFASVGVLVGAWAASGVISFLIVQGLDVVSPRFFLVSAALVTAVVAFATGTASPRPVSQNRPYTGQGRPPRSCDHIGADLCQWQFLSQHSRDRRTDAGHLPAAGAGGRKPLPYPGGFRHYGRTPGPLGRFGALHDSHAGRFHLGLRRICGDELPWFRFCGSLWIHGLVHKTVRARIEAKSLIPGA